MYLRTDNIRSKRPSHTLDYRKIGPFEIVAIMGSRAYKLKLPTSLHIHPVFHVSRLEKYNPDPYARNPKLHPIDTDSPSFTIEEIVDSKTIRAILHYLVKWKDFTSDYNSWEPRRNLTSTPGLLDLANKFHRDHPERAALTQ